MSPRLPALSLTLSVLLAGCMFPAEPGQLPRKQLAAAAGQLSTCDRIEALIASQPNGFPQLRGAYNRTPYGDIWQARYHLIGKGCEVWRAGSSGSYTYVCHRAAPDRASAELYYNEAREVARGCLAAEWQQTEQPRKLGVGVKTVFSKPGLDTVVAVHMIRTDGIFDNQWAIYYLVGLPNDRL